MPRCKDESPIGWRCSRPRNHAGKHVALGAYGKIISVWDEMGFRQVSHLHLHLHENPTPEPSTAPPPKLTVIFSP